MLVKMVVLARWVAVALALILAAPACDDDDGSPASKELGELTLTDQTPDLLLTWIDERGGTHTGVSIAEVPQSSRSLVRVITKDGGHGASLYVADLTQKGDDGTYQVQQMPRSKWEQLIEERREAWREKHAPPPQPTPTATAEEGPPPSDVADIQAIVYGADWCKPCHDAADYLRRKGVRVVEYDIEKEPARAKEMSRKLRDAGMGGGSIPVIDVGGVMLRGFSPDSLERALAKAAKSGTKL